MNQKAGCLGNQQVKSCLSIQFLLREFYKFFDLFRVSKAAIREATIQEATISKAAMVILLTLNKSEILMVILLTLNKSNILVILLLPLNKSKNLVVILVSLNKYHMKKNIACSFFIVVISLFIVFCHVTSSNFSFYCVLSCD